MNEPVTKTIALDPVKEANKLTIEQIDRIQEAIYHLAKNSTNAQAITLSHNLRNCNTYGEQRKWITLFYIQCFQLLSFINMAKGERFDSYSVKEFREEMNNLFQKGNIQ